MCLKFLLVFPPQPQPLFCSFPTSLFPSPPCSIQPSLSYSALPFTLTFISWIFRFAFPQLVFCLQLIWFFPHTLDLLFPPFGSNPTPLFSSLPLPCSSSPLCFTVFPLFVFFSSSTLFLPPFLVAVFPYLFNCLSPPCFALPLTHFLSWFLPLPCFIPFSTLLHTIPLLFSAFPTFQSPPTCFSLHRLASSSSLNCFTLPLPSNTSLLHYTKQ